MSRNTPQRPDADVIPLRRPPKEPLLRDVMGSVLRRVRLDQGRTLKDVADVARISMPYLSEIERGLKEASSEVLAAAARALELSLRDVLDLAQEEVARSIEPTRSTTTRSMSLTSLPVGRTSGAAQLGLRRGDVRLAA